MDPGPEERAAVVPPEDEARIAEEEAEAAAEAARIGGRVPRESDDPAEQPLIESGEGEAEGFELAEEELEENASHGNQRGFPARDVPAPEERSEVEYGEADEPVSTDGGE
ncbi:MAG TPA: hypothetical protein VFR04_02895 [Solirubrobacterales bacterium]|nr:hypothetical protein [Solirubrobacterales bacterium]